MTDFPLPDDLQALAAGYVLGDLSSEEMAEFQQLLIAHPELTQTIAALQDTLSLLPCGLPPQQPDQQVRSRLLAQAENELNPQPLPTLPVSITKPRQASPRQASRRRTSWATRIATSVAITLGGCSLWLTYRVVTLQARLAMAERFLEMAMADSSANDSRLTANSVDLLMTQQWSGLSELVQDHLGSLVRSQGPADVADPNPSQLLAQFPLFKQLPTLAWPQAQLVGGSRCQFGKARGLRLTYQLPASQTVSVYQIDLNGDQFPTFSDTYITLRHHDVSLILWRQQDYLYALAATVPLTDLQTLAQTMKPI